MSLPNFFIVGTPKAGTTALYNYLRQHPDIYLPECKEPHFFSYVGESLPEWGIPEIEAYKQLFNSARGGQVIGEASTWYLYSSTAAEQIHRLLPDSKIIVVLRQPVERAYSSWSFRLQCGWEPIQNFEQAIEAELSRIQSGFSWDFHYLNTGFYYSQLKRYFDLFRRDQIKVYLQEDLKADTAALMQDIFRFLEVDDSYTTDVSEKHNVTRIPKNRWINQFLSKETSVKSFLKKVMPNSLRSTASHRLRKLNNTSVPLLSTEMHQKLTLKYREDIGKTAKLIDRDLSGWLYGIGPNT